MSPAQAGTRQIHVVLQLYILEGVRILVVLSWVPTKSLEKENGAAAQVTEYVVCRWFCNLEGRPSKLHMLKKKSKKKKLP